MNTLKAGGVVPTFVLRDENDNEIHSVSLKGRKTLLYFYPKAMTPGCTIQAQSLRDNINVFSELGIKVYGISTDPVKRLIKFIERDNLNFSLLSDEDHAVAELFGVWGPKKFMGRE